MKIKTINWKVSFITLACINLIILMVVLFTLFTVLPSKNNGERLSLHNEPREAHFSIQTTRDELNELLALKLNEDPDQVVQYHVWLTDEQIEFQTQIPVFSSSVDVQVNLVPEVASNGDLLLHISSIRMGQFQLPQHLVLQLLNEYISFPPYVNIYSSEQMVHLIMSKIIEDESIAFYFKKFDLQTNEIELRMSVQ